MQRKLRRSGSDVQLQKLRSHEGPLSGVPILALTATCTKEVRADIISSLQMQDPAVLQFSFNRPNLQYSVRFKDAMALKAKELAEDQIAPAVVKVRCTSAL